MMCQQWTNSKWNQATCQVFELPWLT